VPEAAQHHRDNDIRVVPCGALAISAQGNVDVVAQEHRQRHVPASPHVDQARRLVRRCEVQRHLDIEQSREADRHVRVPGEIEVHLEGESQDADPSFEQHHRAPLVHGLENTIGVGREVVGEQYLLRQADGEYGQAYSYIFPVDAVGLGLRELGHDLPVVQQRSHDEVREIAHEKQVMTEPVLARLAARSVHQKHDLGEREERDPQRQDKFGNG
jgi:hypothetical protein